MYCCCRDCVTESLPHPLDGPIGGPCEYWILNQTQLVVILPVFESCILM